MDVGEVELGRAQVGTDEDGVPVGEAECAADLVPGQGEVAQVVHGDDVIGDAGCLQRRDEQVELVGEDGVAVPGVGRNRQSAASWRATISGFSSAIWPPSAGAPLEVDSPGARQR